MQGHHRAQYQLGTLYLKGEGVLQDYEKAMTLFQSCKESVDRALVVIGLMYLRGHGFFLPNEREVFRYIKLAADKHYVDGEYYLGKCYFEGIGVEKDITTAMIYFRRAADQGHMGGLWMHNKISIDAVYIHRRMDCVEVVVIETKKYLSCIDEVKIIILYNK